MSKLPPPIEHSLSIPGKSKPYLMAHRGNRILCPENTIAAFRQAISDGADILETDLHFSKDGEIVCIHDDTVDRTTNGHGAVEDYTLAELKQLSAACSRPEFSEERIPTLVETASLLPPDVALALELKTDHFQDPQVCKQLIRIIDQTGIRNRTVLISFQLNRCQAVQALAPDIPIGAITLTSPFPTAPAQLVGPFWPLLLINLFYPVWSRRLGKIVCPLDPTPDKRLWFYRWLKCDAILSDNPAITAKLLKRT